MQVAIGGNNNESNTFCSTPIEMVAFGVTRVDEIHFATRDIEQKPAVLVAGVEARFQYAEVYKRRPTGVVVTDGSMAKG